MGFRATHPIYRFGDGSFSVGRAGGAVDPTALLHDEFTKTINPVPDGFKAHPGPGSWSGSGNYIWTADGAMKGFAQAGVGSPVWGNSARYLDPAVTRKQGRTLAFMLDPEDRQAALRFGWFVAKYTTNITNAGMFFNYDDGSLKLGLPDGTTIQLTSRIGDIRPGEYLFMLMFLTKGFAVFMSGFAGDTGYSQSDPAGIPAYPRARQVYLNLTDTTAAMYAGVSGLNQGSGSGLEGPDGTTLRSLRVKDVAAYAVEDSLAIVADNISKRSNQSGPGSNWSVISGGFNIVSGRMVAAAGGGKILRDDIKTTGDPENGTYVWRFICPAANSINLLFNYVDSTHFNRIVINHSIWQIQWWTFGFISQSNVPAMVAGTEYTVFMDKYNGWYRLRSNDRAHMTNWVQDNPEHNGAGTKVGIEVEAGAEDATISYFGFFPREIDVPAEIQVDKVPWVPVKGSLIVSDDFVATAGTSLDAHMPEIGGAWTLDNTGGNTTTATIGSGGLVTLGGTGDLYAYQVITVAEFIAEVTLKLGHTIIEDSQRYVFSGLRTAIDYLNFILSRLAADLLLQPTVDEVEMVRQTAVLIDIIKKTQFQSNSNGNVFLDDTEWTLSVAVSRPKRRYQVYLNGNMWASYILPANVVDFNHIGIYKPDIDPTTRFKTFRVWAVA